MQAVVLAKVCAVLLIIACRRTKCHVSCFRADFEKAERKWAVQTKQFSFVLVHVLLGEEALYPNQIIRCGNTHAVYHNLKGWLL
jgi:hypothetical protein